MSVLQRALMRVALLLALLFPPAQVSAQAIAVTAPPTLAEILAAIPSTDLGTYAVASLPTCNSGNAKKTAWASNLFGSPQGDRVVCDGLYWKPVRPLAVSIDVTSSNITLTPLLSAPTQVLTGTLGVGVTRSVSLSTTYAYPGAKFCATRSATGLGSLSITGLVGSLTTALGINAWACWEFVSGAGWMQTQSGGLL